MSSIVSSWIRRTLAVAAAVMVPAVAQAQEQVDREAPSIVVSDTVYEIRLADGNLLFARVVAIDGDRITLETTGGVRLEVSRAMIRSFQIASGKVVGGEFWPEDPHATRLFLAPTGRTIRAGQGYFGVHELILPFVSIGISDRFSLAGGAPVLIGDASVVYLAPKFTIVSQPKFHFAIGGLGLFFTQSSEDMGGVFYGVGTFGDRNSALTFAAAWGFAGDEVTDRPVFMLGGEHRISRRVKLLTENYTTLTDPGVVLSGGVRILGDRLSADVGMGAVTNLAGEDRFCCLPIVNFSYLFGDRR